MASSEINLEKSAATHVETTLGSGAINEAKRASDEEHSQTLFQALSANRKAVIWSMLISLSIVMEGYDLSLISNFYAYPEFVRKYGHDYGGSVGWQLSAPWQSALGYSSTVGTIFGNYSSYSPSSWYSKFQSNQEKVVYSTVT
jgi:MFS transporter, SP family, general alpha glucoside:H+ symporter